MKQPSWWTDDRIAHLRKRIAEKASLGLIAQELRTTRNACIGKAHRLGIYGHRPAVGAAGERGLKKIRQPYTPRLRVVATSQNSPLVPVMNCAPVEPLHRSFCDLRSRECKYPYGDGPFSFCGHRRIAGSAYCEDHHALCWRAPEPRRRAAA